MYTVYVLYSERYNKIYIGYTSALEDRLQSHNHLATKGYTIKFRPWDLVFTEEFHSKSEALKREKALKSGQGRAYVWSVISERYH